MKKAVDADELKKVFNGYHSGKIGPEPKFTLGACLQLIDNAPTVKFSLMPADESKDEAYLRGYEKGKVDGFLKARPQGEWLKVKEERMMVDMSGEIVTRYKCSECGRMIAILPSKLADYPFCHCGAAMQKGGAE